MITDKKCIFHIPNALDPMGTSGSQVRPRKMLQAFKNIGYDVDVIMGYGKSRLRSIREIKKKIIEGVKYDFLYSESSTMPTLLTEKNHIPMYPTLDFGFFSFCKQNNIPIGLFYRDIYWKFPVYSRNVKGIKRHLSQLAYRYDLCMYRKELDVLFCPSLKMCPFFQSTELTHIAKELPSGAIYNEQKIAYKKKYFSDFIKNEVKDIKLLYIGGIGEEYNFIKLLEGICDLPNIQLTICCRKNEWIANKNQYEKFLTERVSVVHKFGPDLEELYAEATICMIFVEPSEYRKMAVPVKLFEYIEHCMPIISTKDTAVGEFVKKNNIGWNLIYRADELKNLLIYLSNHPEDILEKHKNSIKILKANTWEKRAEQVRDQLISCRSKKHE